MPGLAERIPVVAIGSNASPARLGEKLGEDAVVPVARVLVEGWAAVYSAHISSYGSISASLWPVPGAVTSVAVAFLDPQQLGVIDASEPNYRRVPVHVDAAVWSGTLTGYLSRRGALSFDEVPIRVDEVPGEGPLPAFDQPGILGEVAKRSGLAAGGYALAHGVGSGAIDRLEVTAWMAANASIDSPGG